MKKLFYFIVTIALVGAIGCGSKDSPTPTPTTCNYTVKYTVNTSGANLSIDTIIYINSAGEEITLLNTNNFDLTFDVKDKVHAKLHVRGNIEPDADAALYKFGLFITSPDNCGVVSSGISDTITGLTHTIPIQCSYDHSF